MTMIQTFPAGGGVGVPSGGTKDQALVKNSNTDKDVTWKTITPGHVIEDSAAAATQRDTVQIKGLSVSDDSTNQKTVIEGVGLNSDSLDDITSGSINNIFVQPSYDYSTTEKIVGKWIDGKPIYQKTIVIPSTTITGNVGNTINIITDNSFDNVFFIYDASFLNTSSVSVNSISFVYDPLDSTKTWWGRTFYLRNDHTVYLNLFAPTNLTISGYITIRYTKTTD